MIKRLIVVLAMVGGFFVVLPTEPALGPPLAAGGATRFNGSKAPAGPVSIPTVDYGGGTDWDCTMTVGAHNYGVYFLQVALSGATARTSRPTPSSGTQPNGRWPTPSASTGIPDDGVYGPRPARPSSGGRGQHLRQGRRLM